jgi:DnaJ domain
MSKQVQREDVYVGKGELLLKPGDIVYDRLIKSDPKKLKRLMRDEMKIYLETHTPGYEEEVRRDVLEHREWKERNAKKSSDYKMLGLDQVKGQILKKDVRNAYRRQSRRLHPDKGGSEEAFKELHAAYRRVLASVPKE